MTQQLTRGMYGTEFKSKIGPFGLRTGQMRSRPKMTHNSGWYNRAGEKIGWGDLSGQDFQKIAQGLQVGEMFLVLSESDSFWNFTKNIGIIGSLNSTTPDAEAPGVAYVAEKAMYAIVPGKLYAIGLWGRDLAWLSQQTTLPCEVLSIEALKSLMSSG